MAVADDKEKKSPFDITGEPEGKPGAGKDRPAKPAGTGPWSPTMINGKGKAKKGSKMQHPSSPYDISGNPEGTPGQQVKKPAKAAGTSAWNPTMI